MAQQLRRLALLPVFNPQYPHGAAQLTTACTSSCGRPDTSFRPPQTDSCTHATYITDTDTYIKKSFLEE